MELERPVEADIISFIISFQFNSQPFLPEHYSKLKLMTEQLISNKTIVNFTASSSSFILSD